MAEGSDGATGILVIAAGPGLGTGENGRVATR